MEHVGMPDWLVHAIVVGIVGGIGAYVRMLVKSVMTEIKHAKELTAKEIDPMKLDISGLRKFAHWANDSLMTVAAKVNVQLPGKHE